MVEGKEVLYSHQKGASLSLECVRCQKRLFFTPFPSLQEPSVFTKISCPGCGQVYHWEDPLLQRQLLLFSQLCHQLTLSEEILSETSIGIHLGLQEVLIPFKLLLTRFNAHLALQIAGKEVHITWHFEPLQDLPSPPSM